MYVSDGPLQKLTVVSCDGVFVHAGPQGGRFSVIQSRR